MKFWRSLIVSLLVACYSSTVPTSTMTLPTSAQRQSETAFLYLSDGTVITTEDALQECVNALSMGDADYAMQCALAAYEKGCYDTAELIAMMYLYGMGVEEDRAQAVVWLTRGADAGNPHCAYELGLIYANALDTRKNLQLACHYFLTAARGGDLDGYVRLSEIQANKGNEAMAFVFASLAAIGGNADGLARMGSCYLNAIGVYRNTLRAISCYEIAVELGSTSAMNQLANLYITGNKLINDPQKGIALYEQSLALGDLSAAMYMGELYERGVHVPKDIDKAIEMYKLAIQDGNIIAEYNLDRLLSSQQ